MHYYGHREVFMLLSEHNVIPGRLAEEMARLTSIRHLLVHKCLNVDDCMITERLGLADFWTNQLRSVEAKSGLLA